MLTNRIQIKIGKASFIKLAIEPEDNDALIINAPIILAETVKKTSLNSSETSVV